MDLPGPTKNGGSWGHDLCLLAMDFEHDIFISYSHLDDEAPFEGDTGWISQFHRAVEVRVGQLLGKKPKIWRDPHLRGNDCFPETLVATLRNVASLVCVLSPRYLKSEWCQRELQAFWEAAHREAADRACKSRVFKVVKTPVPVDEHPPEVRSLLGYDFFKVDPESKRVRELDVGVDPEAKRAYLARVDDLAHDIRDLLEQADEELAAGAAAKGSVYLAETSLDLQDVRDEVKRDLQRHGYAVLPDQTLPLAAEALEKLVGEQIARAKLSIHLVGARYGVVPEGTTQSVVSLQNEVAAERVSQQGGLKRLVWMPPELEVQDERQRELIEAVRADPRTYRESDLLEVPLEDLKTHVHSQLEAIEKPAEGPRTVRETPQVYLICDQLDLESVGALEDHLFDRGLEVILPAFEGDESEVREDHVSNLTSCDAFVFYYGAGGRQWIRNQMRELEKSSGYPGKRPELACAIYVAGPPTPVKDRFRTHLTQLVIHERDRFDPADLEPFLKQIENGRASQGN